MRHARAKVLGGCSSHNSCIAFWAPKEDLDDWDQKFGATGWGSKDTFGLYKKLETNELPGDHHGHDGPVHLMNVPPVDPCGVALLDACEQAGIPRTQFNEGETVINGANFFQVNRREDGTRSSSSVSYLHPIDPRLGGRVFARVQKPAAHFAGQWIDRSQACSVRLPTGRTNHQA